MSQLLDDLVAMRALLGSPGRWMQGSYAARRIAGSDLRKGCSPEDPEAVCWCLDGAALLVTGNAVHVVISPRYRDVREALKEANPDVINLGSYVAWQDRPERRHEEVLALIDQAIATEGGRA